MHLDQILSLLRHWLDRQEQFGPEDAFRFALVHNSKREREAAAYPGSEADPPEDRAEDSRKRTRAREKKGTREKKKIRVS